jgi:hypothetical protein
MKAKSKESLSLKQGKPRTPINRPASVGAVEISASAVGPSSSLTHASLFGCPRGRVADASSRWSGARDRPEDRGRLAISCFVEIRETSLRICPKSAFDPLNSSARHEHARSPLKTTASHAPLSPCRPTECSKTGQPAPPRKGKRPGCPDPLPVQFPAEQACLSP